MPPSSTGAGGGSHEVVTPCAQAKARPRLWQLVQAASSLLGAACRSDSLQTLAPPCIGESASASQTQSSPTRRGLRRMRKSTSTLAMESWQARCVFALALS